jgi:guanylate kinase
MKPTIVAIIGPSCAGKDTLMRQLFFRFSLADLMKRFPQVYYIISSTTRPPRTGERDNEDYHFINNKEFLNKIITNQMLEWTEFRGWKYGTDKSSVSNKPGAINIGVFNLDGVKSIQEHKEYNLVVIYLIVNWKERLRRSIKREGKITFEMIRRMFADWKDFRHPYEIIGKSKLLAYTKDYDIDQVVQDIVGKIE